MFDRIRRRLLEFLRVPPDPTPPAGAPGSLRVFRAGRNYRKLLVLRWGFGQASAIAGLCFSLAFFWWFQNEVRRAHSTTDSGAAVNSSTPKPPPTVESTPNPTGEKSAAKKSIRAKRSGLETSIKQIAAGTPLWLLPVITLLEIGGILLFFAQIPVSFAAIQLDFELHWYIVTDRSLRLRTGLISIRETTMSFANVQQVVMTQGPLQRYLGLADVCVQSAGGGGDQDRPGHDRGDSLHTVVFHAVENAEQIRDLILARLQQFRAAGLGDPEDSTHPVFSDGAPSVTHPVLVAARELLVEARALRATAQR